LNYVYQLPRRIAMKNLKTAGLARFSWQRGSAVLEGALVLLPIMALMLGIIDFSLAVFLRSTFLNAVREGVRYGITGRICGGGTGHDACITAVVQRSAMGFLNGANASRIQIKYFNPTSGVYETGAGSNRSGNILEVCVNGFPWFWIAPIWRSQTALSFSAQSSDLMESQPNGPPAR
jgi:Flp pilus assembly protein TadG